MLLGNRLGVQYLRQPLSAFLSKFEDTDLALSLQNLNGVSGSDVIRARRNMDNAERDFTANEVKGGALVDWVVPTDVQALYGERMWFDGDDDYVELASSVTLSGDFEVELNFTINSYSQNQAILGSSPSNRLGVSTGGNMFISIGGTTTTIFSPDLNKLYKLTITRSGSTVTVLANGVSVFSDTVSSSDWIINAIGRRGSGGGDATTYFMGTVYNINLNNQHFYLGTGNTSADWTDQIGSNNGTVDGSPELFTGQGFNAFVPKWYDQRVPTTTQRMYFDGDDDNVSFGDVLSFERNTPFFIEGEFSLTNGGLIIGKYNSGGLFQGWYVTGSSGSLSFGLLSSGNNAIVVRTVLSELDDGKRHSFRVDYDGSASALGVSIMVDGKSEEILIIQNNLTGSTLSNHQLMVGNRPSGGVAAKGTIYNLNVNGQSSWIGYGNTNADWTDQIGSNDGTVNGNPDRYDPDTGAISKDLTQTTAANQPFIVIDGVVQEGINFNGGKRLLCYMEGPGPVDQGVMYNMKLNSVLTGSGSSNRKTIFRHSNHLWSPGIWMASDIFRQHYLISEPTNGRYWDYAHEYNDLDWHSFVGSVDIFENTSNMWANGVSKVPMGTTTYGATTILRKYFIIGDELDTGSEFSLNAQIHTLVWVKKIFTEQDSKIFNRIIKVN